METGLSESSEKGLSLGEMGSNLKPGVLGLLGQVCTLGCWILNWLH